MRIGAILSGLLPPAPVSVGKGGCAGQTSRAAPESSRAGSETGDTFELSAEAEAALLSQLTDEERREVQQLQVRDHEVRAHEQAHLAAAGQYVRGGPHYEYQTGPDGRRYAVGGEVSLDTSHEKEPEATIRKAQVVRAAALAPAEPSAQDRRVAAKATRMESQARVELQQQQREERESASSDPARPGPTAAPSVARGVGLGLVFDAVA